TAGTIYACKIFRLIRRNRGIQRENIQAEVAILRRLRHVHIISIVGAYVERNRITLVESPVFDFDLDQYLDLVRDAKQTIKAKWFGCLASALTYLHATQVRHKDLKPRNIGIKNGSVTLSGFAISTSFDDDDGSDSEGPPMAYTRRYASPETLEFEPRSRSSDIFSLGCIFFEML
ncbi:kinase-like protein, partial [Ophiobolus disseminans]